MIIERSAPKKADDIHIFYNAETQEFVVANRADGAVGGAVCGSFCGSFFLAANPSRTAIRIEMLAKDCFEAGRRAAKREICEALGIAQ
jgi:hypothetical protein